MKRKAVLKELKLAVADRKYADALVYIEMYYTEAAWKSVSVVNEKYSALDSQNKKLNAIKLQINIRVKGFGWKDLGHHWSKGGVDCTADELKDWFVNKILPEESKRVIPSKPNIDVASREKNLL